MLFLSAPHDQIIPYHFRWRRSEAQVESPQDRIEILDPYYIDLHLLVKTGFSLFALHPAYPFSFPLGLSSHILRMV